MTEPETEAQRILRRMKGKPKPERRDDPLTVVGAVAIGVAVGVLHPAQPSGLVVTIALIVLWRATIDIIKTGRP